MTKKQRAVFGVVVGVPAIIIFAYFTNIGAAIALFFTIYADNVSRGGNDRQD